MSGKLDTNSAETVREKILSAIEGANEIIFDLNGLKYISSSGLRILIAAMKKMKIQGGAIKLKNIDANVKEVLEMTGFSQIFEIA